MTAEKDEGQKQKEKEQWDPENKNECEKEFIDDEELDELMVKTAQSQIRSDYRRSLGCENSRRCMDLHKNKKDE